MVFLVKPEFWEGNGRHYVCKLNALTWQNPPEPPEAPQWRCLHLHYQQLCPKDQVLPSPSHLHIPSPTSSALRRSSQPQVLGKSESCRTHFQHDVGTNGSESCVSSTQCRAVSLPATGSAPVFSALVTATTMHMDPMQCAHNEPSTAFTAPSARRKPHGPSTCCPLCSVPHFHHGA